MSIRRPQACRPAFTIIELLIVCAIIVITAGVVIVVFGAARENARRSVCINNLRQIYGAIRMYCDDWNGTDPVVGVRMSYSRLGLPPIFQGERLDPYLKSRSVWRCINDPHDARVYPRSYAVCFHEDFMIPGVLPFPERIALCGDRIPLYGCPYHGYYQGVDFYNIILRWNGTVKGQNLIWPFTPCMD